MSLLLLFPSNLNDDAYKDRPTIQFSCTENQQGGDSLTKTVSKELVQSATEAGRQELVASANTNKEGDKINQDEAEHLLQEEMPEYEGYINDMVKVPLEQNQFDALCSWVFNLGPKNLQESTLLKLLNAGDYHTTPEQIKRWNKAGGVILGGLVKRREAEANLFEGKEWSKV